MTSADGGFDEAIGWFEPVADIMDVVVQNCQGWKIKKIPKLIFFCPAFYHVLVPRNWYEAQICRTCVLPKFSLSILPELMPWERSYQLNQRIGRCEAHAKTFLWPIGPSNSCSANFRFVHFPWHQYFCDFLFLSSFIQAQNVQRWMSK